MAVYQSQLIFNCTPAQLETALGTTLPAAGYTVLRAPIKYTGTIISGTVAFTATTSSVTNPTILTAVSSVVGLRIGMSLSGTGIPAGTTIVAIGTNTVTMSAGSTASNASQPVNASGVTSQVDFSYDGQYFLSFFGANPITPLAQAQAGIPQNQLDPFLISTLTTLLAATLGAPVPPNLAVPPSFVP